MNELAVTLTVEQLRLLVASAVREELAKQPLVAPPEVLTLQDAADMLHRHPKIVTKLVREEGLPCHFISEREPRFRRSEILAWLGSRPSKPGESEVAA
jgi:hypothetical protein